MLNDSLLSDVAWATKLAEIGANTARMEEAFVVVAKQYPMFAKQYYSYFLALIAEGFTPK